jgi:HEPN domain-containing protein
MRNSTKNWIELSKRDIAAAEELLGKEFLNNIVLFHSQQSVEKILKAILEEYFIEIPRIHHLNKLYKIIPAEIKILINLNEDDLNRLDLIYIDSRSLPENFVLPSGYPTMAEAKQIFDICQNIHRDIVLLLEK